MNSNVVPLPLSVRGTPAEIAGTLTALARLLAIHAVNRPYPDRPPSTLHHVYLDAMPRQTAEESK